MATFGVTVENIRNWFGALQVRYFGARPLIEDNSVRADSSTLTNMRIGYSFTKIPHAARRIQPVQRANRRHRVLLPSFIPGMTAPENAIHFHPAGREIQAHVIANF